jgi:hypothetical protein
MEMEMKAKRVRENEFHILKWKKKQIQQIHASIRPACSIVCHSSNQIKSNQIKSNQIKSKQKEEKKRTNPSSILFK